MIIHRYRFILLFNRSIHQSPVIHRTEIEKEIFFVFDLNQWTIMHFEVLFVIHRRKCFEWFVFFSTCSIYWSSSCSSVHQRNMSDEKIIRSRSLIKIDCFTYLAQQCHSYIDTMSIIMKKVCWHPWLPLSKQATARKKKKQVNRLIFLIDWHTAHVAEEKKKKKKEDRRQQNSVVFSIKQQM